MFYWSIQLYIWIKFGNDKIYEIKHNLIFQWNITIFLYKNREEYDSFNWTYSSSLALLLLLILLGHFEYTSL